MDADQVVRRQGELESQRANFDSHWQEVQDLVLPMTVGFVTQAAPGVKRMDRVFDSTAIEANESFAAAMQSMLTPATEPWHKLTCTDPELADDPDVKAWCDEATDVMFKARYSPRTQFPQAIGEGFLSFGAFGNMVLLIEESRGSNLVYRAGHPREFYYAENEYGTIDTMHRKFQLTARQGAQKFGADMLPDAIKNALERSPDTHFEFIHVVQPRDEAGYGKTKMPNMAFASCYIARAGKKVVRESGYRTFPYAVGRYMTTAGEVYGRGPGMTALPDIKMLQEMMKTHLRAAQKVVDPPLLTIDDGMLAPFQLRPGGINRGGVNSQGQPLVHALVTNARLDISRDMIQDVRNRIKSVFKVDLFRILVDKPEGITATEALIRAQEKGALLAPIGQRAQGEFLGHMISRELDILITAGQLPQMPDALLQLGGAAALKIEYSAPVNQAQKAQKGIVSLHFASAVAELGATMPGVIDAIDGDELVQELADSMGVPSKVIRTPEKIAALRASKQQQTDMATAVQAAPLIGKAARDFATAQAQAGAQPNNLNPLLVPQP